MPRPKPKTNMHAEDVKAKVRKTGLSLAELARQHDLSDSAVRKSLRQPIPRGNAVIAKHLNKPLHALWPEWFDKHGNRITDDRKNTCGAVAKASQKRKAA